MTKLGAHRLQTTLAAISRVEHGGGARERAALAMGLDEWLPFDEPIHVHGGDMDMPVAGFALGAWSSGRWWLVPGGRLLVVPDDPAQPLVLAPLSDVDVEPHRLCPRLREAVITGYVGGVPLRQMSGSAVPVVVSDLMAQVWELDVDGRVAILGALAAAMRPADGWDQAAARLKGGFERGLSDRASVVRTLAARALVAMATGQGPRLPMADPAKMLTVLFAVPYGDVHVATLTALAALEPTTMARMAPVLSAYLPDLAANPNAETRRLAGQLELQLLGRAEADALAAELDSAEPAVRADALRHLTDQPRSLLAVLLPRILDCANDPAPEVREAAQAVLAPLLQSEAPVIRDRILVALLASPEAEPAREALRYLAQAPEPEPGPAVLEELRAALDGPEENRPTVAGLLAASYGRAGAEEEVEGHLGLLRHRDPVVRQAALRGLAAQPPARAAVREDLQQALLEHLRDPEPVLRVETARVIMILRYPRATELVAPLALDPDAVARQGVLGVLKEAGAVATLHHAETVARAAGTLMHLPAEADGDARVQWMGALHTVCQEPSERVGDLLIAVLADIPADTQDPFLGQAMAEIDAYLLERSAEADDLLSLCRRLLEPPWPQPEHACRLAATQAADSPAAMDFLWTVYTESGGAASEAARRALSELVGRPKSRAVVSELEGLLRWTDDPARRDVLRTLLAGDRAAAG